jgi:hypothetical protein
MQLSIAAHLHRCIRLSPEKGRENVALVRPGAGFVVVDAAPDPVRSPKEQRVAASDARNYGQELEGGTGANAGITGAQVGAAVFATADKLEQALGEGHATNLARLL